MAGNSRAKIRIGVGGWTYEPWRGAFYPEGLAQKRELEYAGSKLTSIEINGTYYGSQKPESFAKWRDETPDDFVFSLKATRYATNRRVLAEAGPTIERFFKSGVTELKSKLGPINWQFATTKRFDPDDFAAFLKLLPKSVGGLAIRHAVEVRNESFRTPEFVALAREHRVAVVIAGDSGQVIVQQNIDALGRRRAEHKTDVVFLLNAMKDLGVSKTRRIRMLLSGQRDRHDHDVRLDFCFRPDRELVHRRSVADCKQSRPVRRISPRRGRTR